MDAAALLLGRYRGNRFRAAIISDAVWLYYRFHLSQRDIEDLLAERKAQVSYTAIRLWCHGFGAVLAAGLRRHPRRAGDKWRLDEVQLKIRGKRCRRVGLTSGGNWVTLGIDPTARLGRRATLGRARERGRSPVPRFGAACVRHIRFTSRHHLHSSTTTARRRYASPQLTVCRNCAAVRHWCIRGAPPSGDMPRT